MSSGTSRTWLVTSNISYGGITNDEDEEDEEGGDQGVQDGAVLVQVERAAVRRRRSLKCHGQRMSITVLRL
jgi:hypothetical protein